MTENRLNFPPYQTLLVICCSIVFGCYLGTYMRLPIVPLYARSLGANTVLVGIINSAFFLTAGLLSLPSGMVSDRLGYKLVAASGLLILSATSFLLFFSRTAGQLVWIYLLAGAGLAAFGPTIMSFVADFSPPTHLGRSYGWYTTALYSGMTLGPGAGGFLVEALGFPRTFFISGAFILIPLGVLLLFLPRGRSADRRPATADRSAGAWDLLRNRALLGCWLGTLGGCFALGMFITFVPLHAHDQGLSLGQIGLVFSLQGIANAVSRIPFGHLSDRVSNRSLLAVLGLTGVALCVAGYGISTTLAHFLVMAIGLGFSMGLAFTSIGALTAEVVPPRSRGLAMGGYNSCIYLGMMLSAALMGGIIKKMGFAGGFGLAAVVGLLVTGSFYLLLRDFSPDRAQAAGREEGPQG
jgi:DHA1 family multidrug resistance protein-like MFS transporter